jgi:hypothetical protein
MHCTGPVSHLRATYRGYRLGASAEANENENEQTASFQRKTSAADASATLFFRIIPQFRANEGLVFRGRDLRQSVEFDPRPKSLDGSCPHWTLQEGFFRIGLFGIGLLSRVFRWGESAGNRPWPQHLSASDFQRQPTDDSEAPLILTRAGRGANISWFLFGPFKPQASY